MTYFTRLGMVFVAAALGCGGEVQTIYVDGGVSFTAEWEGEAKATTEPQQETDPVTLLNAPRGSAGSAAGDGAQAGAGGVTEVAVDAGVDAAVLFDPTFFIGSWSRRGRMVDNCGETPTPAYAAWGGAAEIEVTADFEAYWKGNGNLWLTIGEFVDEVWYPATHQSGERDVQIWVAGDKAAGVMSFGCKDYEMEWMRLAP